MARLCRPGCCFAGLVARAEDNDAIEEALNLIPDNLSVDETMDRVYQIQSRAAVAFADGKVLTSGNQLSQSEWLGIFTGAN